MGVIRLSEVDSLKGKYALLLTAKAEISINEIINLIIYENPIILKTQEVDFSDTTKEKVLSWLKNLPISKKIVYLYWVSPREGIKLNFDDFAANYDELWYPSTDDVLVVDIDRRWIIVLNHEEIFSLYIKVLDTV